MFMTIKLPSYDITIFLYYIQILLVVTRNEPLPYLSELKRPWRNVGCYINLQWKGL